MMAGPSHTQLHAVQGPEDQPLSLQPTEALMARGFGPSAAQPRGSTAAELCAATTTTGSDLLPDGCARKVATL